MQLSKHFKLEEFTKSMTRKANILVNKFKGGNAGYGLVLEELVNTKGPVPTTTLKIKD